MKRDEMHRLLFSNMEGRQITFKQKGMPFRVMRPNSVFGGVAYFDNNKCRIRIVHRQESEEGKRYEVRFPDVEWKLISNGSGEGVWTNKVEDCDSTLVGYMEITGNWKAGTGKCIFHSIGNR
ncbi:MAG: hypothetical protein J6Q22_09995 [Prevotella sp.]|nr:hypothetical protein [Prevotella sp.]